MKSLFILFVVILISIGCQNGDGQTRVVTSYNSGTSDNSSHASGNQFTTTVVCNNYIKFSSDAVHAPGMYGEAKCLSGVEFSDGEDHHDLMVELDGVQFNGVAYPDRQSLRVLVKVTSLFYKNKDGQARQKEVDGYLQDQDNKPGMVADFTMINNTLTLKAGSSGRLVLLRSVNIN